MRVTHLLSRWHRIVLLAAILFFLYTLYRTPGQLLLDSEKDETSQEYLHRKLQYFNNDAYAQGHPNIIMVKEKMLRSVKLSGALLSENGVVKYLSVPGETGLIHSFSPQIEKSAAERVVDAAHDNVYFANSPAIAWHRGRLVLIVRIWLDREKYEKNKDWPANQFADNFLFTQSFDKYLHPVNNGSFMGIPIPKQFWVGDGPIEPRVFKVGDKLLVSFNAAMALRKKFFVDWTTLWDFDDNKPIFPNIKGGSPMLKATDRKDDIPRDKHWMSFVKGGKLHFIHNLDPLRVMRCELSGQCEFVYRDESSGFVFHRHKNHLRGGTPMELYKYPYYIGFAHVTLYKQKNHHRYYTANFMVFCGETYRVVFMGDPVQIHPSIYKAAPMVRPRWIDDNFIFPVGIILEDPDTVALGVHANDHSSILLRIRGIQKLMKTIIMEDIKAKSIKGPNPMFMHKYVYERISNLTNIQFENHHQ